MSWAVGELNGRHIGYGVPAICDLPGCGKDIDRGLSFACGGGVVSNTPNCGLFFCTEHLLVNPSRYSYSDEHDVEGDYDDLCPSCASYDDSTGKFLIPPYTPTPDTQEWIDHVLTDESWAKFREQNPNWGKQ